ncbi:unnamed protein product [Lupinus luteus]|uniref:mTERF protein n=1 Tax=Lupinus luteus TaxID=3873 RepID=A0AAV1Y2I5_LUPLU
MIFKSHHYQNLLYLISQTTSPFSTTHFLHPFPFSLKLFTTTTTSNPSHSFTVSYLINNLGFPSETATKVSKRLRFDTSQKPDKVVAFFINYGFSVSQVNGVLRRLPQLLLCDTHKFLLPKFEFLASKGASTSEIVLAVSSNPRFLNSSLENSIIPMYELLSSLFQSDEEALDCFFRWPNLLGNKKRLKENLKLLRDEGVRDSKIARLIRSRASVFDSYGLKKAVDEVKELGLDPSKGTFVTALTAKLGLSKLTWNAKVDVYKRWGWSEEDIVAAFRRNPTSMLVSKDKIDATMSFWVNQLGWDSSVLALSPAVLGLSLEKRVIPRAYVVEYLITKGLRKKNASLITPFLLSEKLFLEKYVQNFKEETSELLKLYLGDKKPNFQDKD